MPFAPDPSPMSGPAAGSGAEAASAGDTALALVRAGHLRQAIPYLEQAVAGGDHRAEYLLGVALYNGDEVVADASRASALLRAAADGGIRQARAALDDMAGSSGPADAALLVSDRCARLVGDEFARLKPFAGSTPMTLEAVARELLRPLLRDRLEVMLPPVAHRAVERALRDAQARSERS